MSVDMQVWVSVISAAAIAAILFRGALVRLFRLAGRTALGGVLLAILAHTSGWTGISLGVNLVNAFVLGVLGVPGFGLLWALSQITA